jgi:GNAT superfamily N-acetyltransferase
MTTIVRIATKDDEPEVLRLLESLYDENALMPVSWDKVKAILAKAWNKQGGLIGVIGAETPSESGVKQIYAMIMLTFGKFWYSDTDHLEELFCYVHPEHRRSDYAKTLIAQAKRWSEQIGVPLFMGIVTNRLMTEKVKLYRRYLGDPVGAFFIHNMQWQNDMSPEVDFWSNIPKSNGTTAVIANRESDRRTARRRSRRRAKGA